MRHLPWALCLIASALFAQQQKQKLYPDNAQFGSTRLFYWGANHSEGHCVINHGQPPWNQKFQKAIDAGKFRRWRFGKNHWTTLDCDVPLEFASGPTIPPGHYFLALDLRDEQFGIVFLDPQRVRPRHLDSYQAHLTVGGTFVALKNEDTKTTARTLKMQLAPSGKGDGKASLTIEFGPHKLTTTFEMKPRARKKTLPDVGVSLTKDTQWILEHAKSFELFALHPEDEASGKAAFHGYKILGRKTLDDAKKMHSLLGLVYRGISEYDDVSAGCFLPRHGVRAKIGHLFVDLVICFECKQLWIFRDDAEERGYAGTGNGAVKDMNALFASLGLKIAE